MQSLKNKKFLYFEKWNFLAPNLKNVLYFSKKNLYISFSLSEFSSLEFSSSEFFSSKSSLSESSEEISMSLVINLDVFFL